MTDEIDVENHLVLLAGLTDRFDGLVAIISQLAEKHLAI